MSEPISPLIQIPIREGLHPEHHGHRLRCALHLLLEQLMDTFVLWIVPLRPVPFHEDLMAFRLRHQP